MERKTNAIQAFKKSFFRLCERNNYQYSKGTFIKMLPEAPIVKYIHPVPTIEGGWDVCFNIKTPLDYSQSFKEIQNEGIYSLFYYIWHAIGQYPGRVIGNSLSEWEKSYKLAQLRSIGFVEITDWSDQYKDLMENLDRNFPSIDEIMSQRYTDFEDMVLQEMENVTDVISCHVFHTNMMISTHRGIWDEKRLMWYAIAEENYDLAVKYISRHIDKCGSSVDEQDDALLLLHQLSNKEYLVLRKELEDRYNLGLQFFRDNYRI